MTHYVIIFVHIDVLTESAIGCIMYSRWYDRQMQKQAVNEMEEEKIGSGYTDIGRRMIALFYEYLDKCRKNGRLATLAGFRAANIIPSDMYEEYSRTDG